MAADKFIPQIWSAKILDALDKTLVYAQLFSSDYEGEITDVGDTVHIAQVGDVAIKDFQCDTDLEAPDDVTTTDTVLKIDQAKYFNIAVCDVNEVQSKINLLDTATQRAGYGFSDVCDQYLGGLLAKDAGVVLGSTTAPTVITEQNAYEQMVQIKTALDKANLPKAGRKVVVPPEYEGFMLLDPRFVQVGTDASNDRLEMGTIYRAAGLEVLVSNNAPTFKYETSKTGCKLIATSDLTCTFAQQILKTEAYRPEKRFADAVKGLHVYGAKVTRPAAVVVANVAF